MAWPSAVHDDGGGAAGAADDDNGVVALPRSALLAGVQDVTHRADVVVDPLEHGSRHDVTLGKFPPMLVYGRYNLFHRR
jgi:hypothetical protein